MHYKQYIQQTNEYKDLCKSWKDSKKQTLDFFGQRFRIHCREENHSGHQFLICSNACGDICLAAKFSFLTIIVLAKKDLQWKKRAPEQAREMYAKVVDGSWSFLADLVTSRLIVNRLKTRGPEMRRGMRERKVSESLICQRTLHSCNIRETYASFSSSIFPSSKKNDSKHKTILRAFV